jgi:uncharacterized protein YebE (UPF0316 family)
MTWDVFLSCLLIVGARIVDVSLGTIRTICVVNGRRGVAWFLGFFEVLVWILVVSNVIEHLQNPAYAIAYALGFATGNYIGITIDRHVGFGEQVVRVFTRKGAELADYLRNGGFRVTEFAGTGRDGPVEMLFIETPRRLAAKAAVQARKFDAECFIVVDDVRSSSLAGTMRADDWRSVVKKK